LIIKFRFRPWELEDLTISETIYLYVNAMNEEAERAQSKDERLAPHKTEEKRQNADYAIAQARAFNQLTPDQLLELAYLKDK
jgi:hypothetical protein